MGTSLRLRAVMPLGLHGISLALLLLVTGCSDEPPVDRDPDGVSIGDDDAPDDDAADDDAPADDDAADDDGDDEDGKVDAFRPGGRVDAGTGQNTRKDAAAPQSTLDASERDSGRAEPSDASSGDDPADASAADASSPDEPRADLGKGDGKDVVTIGDSWMLYLRTGIQESLVEVSGQPYRKYARPGTRLLDDVIPGQYATAKRADADIKTVVMTGGGNDIIQNATLKADCMNGGTACDEQVSKIRMRLAELWKEMSADGVQDVIHVMYSKSAGSGVKNRAMHNMQMAEVCASVPPPLRCHLLDTDELIGPSDMRSDGIHPTDPGYDKIGKAVFELMEEKGMRR